jgi:hypothetical protein
MRNPLTAALIGLSLLAAPAAFADCVDYDPARVERFSRQLQSSPPSASALGMPTLNGLTLDARRTAGAFGCGSAAMPAVPNRVWYTTDLTLSQVVAQVHAHIAPKTNRDGMNRDWYENPLRGDSFRLTSGTTIGIQRGAAVGSDDYRLLALSIEKAASPAPLTTASQPYSVADVASGTPWPGGRTGPRQFVRADGGNAGYQAANNNSYAPPVQQTQTPTPPACPTPTQTAQSGAQTGGSIGAEIGGAAIGGGYGRSVGRDAGRVLGGVLGAARNRNTQQTPPADPNCR